MSPRPPEDAHAASRTFESSAASLLADGEFAAARTALDAANDALSVLGRREWEVAVTKEGERFRRSANPYAVVVVGVDGLREVDHQQGPVAGDDLIALTGTTLRACVRPGDTVAHIGEYEFGVLAVECDLVGATALTARLNDAFAAAGVNASLGTAAARPGRDGIATWVAATAAMLDSKVMLGSFEAPVR